METWWITSAPWIRVFLALVFLLAGVSKLRHRDRFAAALGALGIVHPVPRKSLEIVVPLVEAGIGAWLVSGWKPISSTLTASVGLVTLTGALVALRKTGYTGSCGCFVGDDGPVGGRQIARNGGLVGLSLLAALGAYRATGAAEAPSSPWEWSMDITATGAVLLLGGYLLLGRRVGLETTTDSAAGARGAHDPSVRRSAESAEPPSPNTEVVTPMEWKDQSGEDIVLGQPKADAQLVVFAKGGCPGCIRDRDILNRLQGQMPMELETVIVCGGDLEATKGFASAVRPPVRVVADPRWRTAVGWQVKTTPFSVLVDRQGYVRARGKLGAVLSLLKD